MELDFFGVYLDNKSGKWKYKHHKVENKTPTFAKNRYSTPLFAAYARDCSIRGFTEDERRFEFNRRNFDDEELIKLKKIHQTCDPGKSTASGNNLTIENDEVKEIVKRFVMTEETNTRRGEIILTPTKTALADEAFDKIKGIFLKHYQNALLEVGEYVAKTFFNDDPKLFSNQSPVKGKEVSFNQLSKKLQDNVSSAPSQSWLTNAVRVYFDRKLIEKTDKKALQTFAKLTSSHWIKLLPVKSIKKKIKFIHMAYNDNLSVKALGERISPTESTDDSPGVTFKSFKKNISAQFSDIKKFKGIKGTEKEQAMEDALSEFLKKIEGILKLKESKK